MLLVFCGDVYCFNYMRWFILLFIVYHLRHARNHYTFAIILYIKYERIDMYTSPSYRGAKRRQESSLLGRAVNALTGSCVSITLSNGSNISGYVLEYKKQLQTYNIYESLLELRRLEAADSTFVLPDDISHMYDRFKNTLSGCMPRSHMGRHMKSHVVLADATICYSGRSFVASKVEISEECISTVVPSNIPRDENKHYRNVHSADQLKRLILQEPSDRIKNAAFLRCSRIGQHNSKH
ncbi:hypothetical protein BBOV_II002945 [Babesia bovis T2Bo]|uniref:hypothetical protein n=1 Tax=Babesia bovis T2Bo TaxID=484906 RepID=UPI001C34F45F|nr:hypothetical protein BBOV_II002945 [Babesia bovis T2Bo]KAG6440125.1 hypothetical protein BBOV_II002945 [Babesia bovis T2Bo]